MRYGLLILYGVLGAIIILVILNFVWPPAHLFFAGAWSFISGGLGDISIGDFSVSKLITDNISGIVGLAIGAVGTLIGYMKIKSLTGQNEELLNQITQLDDTKSTLEAGVQGLSKTVSNQADELEMYAKDSTAQVLQSRITEIQKELSTKTDLYEKTIADQNKQIRELTDKLEARPVVEVPTYK